MFEVEEHRRYADSTRLEPIIEQQDDEMTTSPTSNSSLDEYYLNEEEQRAHEEIQQFEKLEKEFASRQHGIRVKFDDERLIRPVAQTTVIKTEPCFQINSTEDQVTKHFYQNEYQSKNKKNKIIDQVFSSSPSKSILKKPEKSTSLKKKQTFSNRSDSNQVQHLAEVTAKQITSPPSCRSLFEPTINIFDSSNSNTRRSSRLQYYIKPYRGEAYIHPIINKRQSSSLAQPTVWYNCSNQYNRSLNKRQHVSWSPVRDYIHQGRDKIVKTPTKRKELFSSPLSTRSSSNPCLRNSSSSMIPVSIRSRSSQHVSPSPLDSYETSSMIDYSQYTEKKEIVFVSPLPDIVHPQKNEHSETMQRYDRLLEKMRATDEQLHILSRSWANNTQQKPSVSRNQLEGEILIKSQSNKTTSKNEFLSPMILQVCLMILVIFNLLAVYFFNEINLLWSQYVGHTVIAEQHDEGTSNF